MYVYVYVCVYVYADSKMEEPSEEFPLFEEENPEDQSESDAVRTRVIPNNKRYEIFILTVG